MRNKVSNLIVKKNQSGQRIDNFLMYQFRSVPRSIIYKILRTGQVRVNGLRVKPSYKTKSDDKVRIPPISFKQKEKTYVKNTSHDIKKLLIYEDDFLIVVNKPAGISVHSGTSEVYGLIDMLRDYFVDCERLELAHRLDKPTSGCLIVTKTTEAMRLLQSQFRNKSIKKLYTALVCGRWSLGEILVDDPILYGNEKKRIKAKASKTRFAPVEYYEDSTLLEVETFSGRTHQIRLHAQSKNHSLLGDTKYGNKIYNQNFRKMGLRRLFLHANKLIFSHPISEKTITVNAPLSDDLKIILNQLQ
ncbi:MAG: RluA family pseudouridine synthase [Pseudomonadota bacterium]